MCDREKKYRSFKNIAKNIDKHAHNQYHNLTERVPVLGSCTIDFRPNGRPDLKSSVESKSGSYVIGNALEGLVGAMLLTR